MFGEGAVLVWSLLVLRASSCANAFDPHEVVLASACLFQGQQDQWRVRIS